jgi:hypothetical protein
MGVGTRDVVNDITKLGTDIVIGGSFTSVIQTGGTPLSAIRIALWTPSTTTWSAMGLGFNSNVLKLYNNGTDLFCCGAFTQTGNYVTTFARVAKWNTTTSLWESYGGVNGNANDMFELPSGDMVVFGAMSLPGFGGITLNGYSCALVQKPANFMFITGQFSQDGDLKSNIQFTGSGAKGNAAIVMNWSATDSAWLGTRFGNMLLNT